MQEPDNTAFYVNVGIFFTSVLSLSIVEVYSCLSKRRAEKGICNFEPSGQELTESFKASMTESSLSQPKEQIRQKSLNRSKASIDRKSIASRQSNNSIKSSQLSKNN